MKKLLFYTFKALELSTVGVIYLAICAVTRFMLPNAAFIVDRNVSEIAWYHPVYFLIGVFVMFMILCIIFILLFTGAIIIPRWFRANEKLVNKILK